MSPPPLIILPARAKLMLDFWQHCRVDPVRRLRNAGAVEMTVATIGSFGAPLYRHYRPRHWRLSWGMVCVSLAWFAGAYLVARRVPPDGAE
jgi:hypothetical protein